MVIQKILSGLLLLAAAPAAAVGEPRPLDLAAAMAAARARAPEIAAAGARREAAAFRLSGARGARLPSVRLSEIWTRTDSPAEAFAWQLNQERFSFPAFAASDPNHPDPLTAAQTRLEVEMPLFTGGEIGSRIAQAGLGLAAATDSAGATADGAALAAAEAYVDLGLAREQVRLLERSRETVAAHVDLARSFDEQGMVVRSELLRAEVELARVDDLLAEARGRERVAEANLSFRLGEPLSTSWELADLPPLPAAEGAAPLADWLATAAGRRDLAAAGKLLAAGELEEVIARATRRPRVGLLARHDRVDDRPFGTHGSSTTVMAMASLSLFDGGRARAAEAAARADAEAGRQDLARFESAIALEIEAAYEAAQAARLRLATARAAVAAGREGARITDERFRAGVARALDWIDATTALREAETRELAAKAEAHRAAFRLAVAAGRTPESILGSGTPAPEGDPR